MFPLEGIGFDVINKCFQRLFACQGHEYLLFFLDFILPACIFLPLLYSPMYRLTRKPFCLVVLLPGLF